MGEISCFCFRKHGEKKAEEINISAVVYSPWILNVTLLKQELGKIIYFSSEVSFAAMINKLNQMIRHKLFANITENQISNLVLFHKKAIFQVVLISTSRKIHAQ